MGIEGSISRSANSKYRYESSDVCAKEQEMPQYLKPNGTDKLHAG